MGAPTETLEVVLLNEIVNEFPEGFSDYVMDQVDVRFPSIVDVEYLVITGLQALDLLRTAWEEARVEFEEEGLDLQFETYVDGWDLEDGYTLVAIE
jgi:hypothetical protein